MALDWPQQFDRTPPEERERTRKFKANLRQTKRQIQNEMEMIDAMWRLADDATGDDPGIVLRWQRAGQEYAIACDHYRSKAANARAVYLWVNETRKSGDRPVKTGQDQFAAAALPPGNDEAVAAPVPPHEILEVGPNASPEVVKAAFKARVHEDHPDKGSGQYTVQELKRAREAMLDG